MELYAAVMGPGPYVRERSAQLGMPHQRREVLDDDGHADVVDGAVRGQLDGSIRGFDAAEQPNVTSSCQFRSVI